MRSYQTARRIFGFIEIVAILVIIAGIAIGLAGLAILADAASGRRFPGDLVFVGLVPGAIIVFIGLFGIVIAQSARASVDTAELTGQILKVARDQLEVSKQGQRPSHSAPTDFSSFVDRKDQTDGADFTTMTKPNGARTDRLDDGSIPAISATADAALPPPSVGFENLAPLKSAKKVRVAAAPIAENGQS